MSKGWPDPFHDRGDDFWDFDNMVSEYEWEEEHKKKQSLQPSGKPDGKESFMVRHTALAVIILVGLLVLSIMFPLAWIAFFIYLICAFK